MSVAKHCRTVLSVATLAAAAFGALPAGAAQTLSCPALETATQVAACPTEAELHYTYLGYCGDNARVYAGDAIICATFENYKQHKNLAMWEAADGQFSGYLDCNVAPDTIRASAARSMRVEQRRGITQLICEYDNGHRLVHRTRAQCKVEVAECTASGCSASCEDEAASKGAADARP